MAEQLGRRPTDVRGIYAPNGKRYDIQTPQDLVSAGLGVNIDGVRRAWGEEGVTIYARGMMAKGLEKIIPPSVRAQVTSLEG